MPATSGVGLPDPSVLGWALPKKGAPQQLNSCSSQLSRSGFFCGNVLYTGHAGRRGAPSGQAG
eukprot:5462858-Prymnesium_polylepis.1